MARPTKLTPAVQEAVCKAIEAGNHYLIACRCARIDYDTFRRWMNAGRRSGRGQFHAFYVAVRAAEAKAESDAVALWVKAMPESWQAVRDFLARRFPARWAANAGEVRELTEELRRFNDERRRAGEEGGAEPGTTPAGGRAPGPAPPEPD